MARKEAEIKHDSEWSDTAGNRHQLCVVEELDAEAPQSAYAIITFGGFSLCRTHFEVVTGLIKTGTPMGAVVHTMMTTGLDNLGDAFADDLIS